MPRGMNTIEFGKVKVMGESVSLSELKETLFEIMDKFGYPSESYQKEVSTDDADVSGDEVVEEDDELALELKKEELAQEEEDAEEEEKPEVLSGDDADVPPWVRGRRRK